MNAELDDGFWNDLLVRIGEGEVVPVVGAGTVTFRLGNELLYPWIAQRLPAKLDPPLTFEEPPCDLQEIADAQRAKGQLVERIYRHLHRIVEDPEIKISEIASYG